MLVEGVTSSFVLCRFYNVGDDPSAGERNLLGNDEEVVSENSNGPRNPTDCCETQGQKEQSSAHFGFSPTSTNATTGTIGAISTASTCTITDTAIAPSAAVTTTAASSTASTTTVSAATTTSVAVTVSTAAGGGGGKADSVGVPEGGAIGGKGKERHQEGQGRDSGSMVMVHGILHSLDLVGLICYSKIKMKFTGSQYIHTHTHTHTHAHREREYMYVRA